MQYEVEVNGRTRSVTVQRHEGRFAVVLDDQRWVVDAAAIGSQLLSLLMERAPADGDHAAAAVVESREMSLTPDPVSGQLVVGIGAVQTRVDLASRRRWGRRDDAHGSGPQRLVAPMPGKIVRVLARAGDHVAQRQPVIVIEAMKMENALRAASDGVVSQVFVQEGQSVEAGAALVVITPQ